MVVDFEAVVKKRLRPGVKPPDILKACKLKPHMRVLDATAGWGRDAAVLASTGAEVFMCERVPQMAALLEDGLKRLNAQSQLNLKLIPMDAMDYLAQLKPENYPDVIYLDPMHPLREKTAQVKKDLSALQALIGPDDDIVKLLATAKEHVKFRTVLKWPAKQPAVTPADYVISGKTVRFDVYVRRKLYGT